MTRVKSSLARDGLVTDSLLPIAKPDLGRCLEYRLHSPQEFPSRLQEAGTSRKLMLPHHFPFPSSRVIPRWTMECGLHVVAVSRFPSLPVTPSPHVLLPSDGVQDAARTGKQEARADLPKVAMTPSSATLFPRRAAKLQLHRPPYPWDYHWTMDGTMVDEQRRYDL